MPLVIKFSTINATGAPQNCPEIGMDRASKSAKIIQSVHPWQNRFMKRIILLLALFSLAISASAQPYSILLFTNDSTSLITNGLTGVPAASSNSIKVALYYGPDGVTDESTLALSTNGVLVGNAGPGRYNGLTRYVPYSVSNYITIQVRAFESTYGPTYDAAYSAPPANGRRAMVGKSPLTRVLLTTSTNGPTAPKVGPLVGPITVFPVDGVPVVTADDIAVSEGSNGTASATFTIRLLGPAANTVSVDFATSDGTATAANDYVATSGTVTFAPGETSKPVTVTLTPDVPPEPDETFNLLLSNPVNATLLRSTIVCTIVEAATNAVALTGFSPASGAIGASMTLTGEGFSPEASSNIVFFSGGVRATVIGASETSLTVTVPPGAVYGPITITVGRSTARSTLGFDISLPPRILDSSAFDAPLIFNPGNGPGQTRVADFDGDGRPDLAVAHQYGVAVFRNSGTGSVAGIFSPKFDLPVGQITFDLHAADFDGDGKLDLVAINYNESTASIFRNISTNGVIASAPKVDFAAGTDPHNSTVGDIDGDGKLELIVTSFSQGKIRILRNTSGPGSINFAPPVEFATLPAPHGVGVQDLDGDGKPDVVVVSHTTSTPGTIIFRNVSTPGVIDGSSLQAVGTLPANGASLAFGDFDGDGRPDLVTCSWFSSSVTIYQNLHQSGGLTNTSFGPPVTLPSAGRTKRIAVTDLDGDGRVDLAFPSELSDALGIYRNIGGTNGINSSWFAPRLDLACGWNGDGISIGDIDLDGMPDIAFVSQYDNQVWIYRGVVLTAPAITAQPTNTTIALGGSGSLTVQATGGGLHFAWYRNGALLQGAGGSTFQINNARGTNAGDYFVVVSNSGGAVTSTVATVTVLVDRTLALGAVADINEGDLISVPLTLVSSGEVGGMDFLINFDANALAVPDIGWDSSLDTALKDFSSPGRGQVRCVIALPATAIPAGTQTLATIQFRARTIIQTNVHVSLALSLSDMSDTSGNPIVGGTDVVGTELNIHDVGYLAGDNNANQQLDIGDASLLLRLIAQLDSTRYWDVSANDFNLNQHLDSGDVIKMLRVIAGMDPMPNLPPPTGGSNQVQGGQSPKRASLVPELASLSPALFQGSNGQLVTVQLRLDNVRTLISGASFTLNYPVEALSLGNAQSYRMGPTVPGGTLAVWNVAPDQTNYVTQNGHLTIALSGSTPWNASNSVLAEFTFEVQPTASARYLWPLTVTALQITDGFNTRTLPSPGSAFIGRPPVSGKMFGLSVVRDGDASFQFSGDVGANYRFEYSDDLVHWSLLREVLNHTGPIQIDDPGAGSLPQRFYRNMPF